MGQTLERIAAAFAEAVAVGEFERAEGWFAVARWHVLLFNSELFELAPGPRHPDVWV